MATGTCLETETHFEVLFIQEGSNEPPRVGSKEVDSTRISGGGGDQGVRAIITYKYKIYCYRNEQVGSVLARAYDTMWKDQGMGPCDPTRTISCLKMDNNVRDVEHAAIKYSPMQADTFNYFLGEAIGNVVVKPEQTNRITLHQNTKICMGPCVLCWGCICCGGWDPAPLSFMKRAPPGATVEATVSSQPLKQQPMAPPPSFEAATGNDIAARLAQLGALRQQGVLTQEEFEAKKAPLLALL